MNALTGGKHKPQNQSPLVGLASSLLGGQHGGQTSQSSSGSGGFGGIAGQLVGSFFDSGGKPQQQQQQQSANQQSGGGFMSFLGGHSNSSVYPANPCRCRHMLIDIAESEQQLRVLIQRAKLKYWWLFSPSSTSVIPGTRPAWICECPAFTHASAVTECKLEQRQWRLLLPSSTSFVSILRSNRIYYGTAYASATASVRIFER